MPYDDEAFYRLAEDAEPDADRSDARGHFARDRDRIIYSSAFRRLAGKTQVVAAGELGLFHTRLTHSLKVAQLGRRLAERMRDRWEAGAGRPVGAVSGPDPDLVEAACLAHDIGHPPFGHIGEATLRRASDEVAEAAFLAAGGEEAEVEAHLKERAGFEGNAQTFRILTYLSAREPVEGRFGLDLTRASLDAATKYPRTRAQAADMNKEWGAYCGTDADRMTTVRQIEPMGRDAQPCFEAQVMDWCDDVAYAVHDLIDFYRGDRIPLNRLFAIDRSGELSPDALRFLAAVAPDRDAEFDELVAAWTEIAQRSDIQIRWEPRARIKEQVQSTTSRFITYLVDGVGWTTRGEGDNPRYTFDSGEPLRYSADLVIDPDPARASLKRHAVWLLKKLLRTHVIERPELQTQQHGQASIVSGLLQAHYENPKLLPPDRREERAAHGDDVRAAVDHIASLTEEAAIALYRRVSGVSLGRFSDIL